MSSFEGRLVKILEVVPQRKQHLMSDGSRAGFFRMGTILARLKVEPDVMEALIVVMKGRRSHEMVWTTVEGILISSTSSLLIAVLFYCCATHLTAEEQDKLSSWV